MARPWLGSERNSRTGTGCDPGRPANFSASTTSARSHAYPFPLSMAVRAIAASENQMNQLIKCTLDCAAAWGRCASPLLSSVMFVKPFLLTECIFWTRPAEPLPFRSGRSRAGSRTRRSPRVEQVEPRLAVDGDQPFQQAVARLDGRPAVGAVAGLVHAPLAGVAPPVRGEPVLLPEAAPLERQPVSRRGGGRWRGTSRGRATGRRVARRRVGSRTCHVLRTKIEDSCGVMGSREIG